MTDKPQYKIAGGQPTAKWKAAAAGGSVGLPVGVVTAYYISVLLPDVPGEVQMAMNLCVVAVITWAATQGPALLAAWLKRPDPRDVPVVDLPPPVEGIPDHD